jgi:hypothetical protein
MDVLEESAACFLRVAEEPACEEQSRTERQLKLGLTATYRRVVWVQHVVRMVICTKRLESL